MKKRAAGNRRLLSGDSDASYLASSKQQLAVEPLIIRFGEALKDVSPGTLQLDLPPMFEAIRRWLGKA